MERSSVHIAVLVVADDPATVDLAGATFVADRVSSAGHRVVAQEIVESREAAIRDQLARWISQGHIDVIIGAGAGEAAMAALGPLVTSPLQGLTDQLRLLARDRGGEGKPAAARCGGKFVFLLPAEIPALGPALNQLVLPQLDSTQARNLVGEMPRHLAVPRELPPEKTASGAGVIPKPPASSREKRKTGANVIARSELAEPTKQTVIDPAKVGDATAQTPLADITKQTPAAPPASRGGSANDAPTRPHIDIASMLPPVPPGADIDTDEEPALVDRAPVTVQPARSRPHPNSNDKTVVRPGPNAEGDKTAVRAAPTRPGSTTNRGVQPTPAIPNRVVQPTPVLGSPAPRSSIGVAKTPQAPGVAKTPQAPVVPSIPSIARPATPAVGSQSVKPAPALAPTPLPTIRMPSSVTPPAATPTVPPSNGTSKLPAPTPVSGVKTATAEGKGVDVVNTAALAAKADAESSADEVEALSSANILESVPDDGKASFESRTPPPVPPRAAARTPARPAVPPETKPIDPAVAEAKLAAAAASRPAVTKLQIADLPKPELLDLSEGVSKKRRSRTGTALVRRRTSSAVLLYLALACTAVAGFAAVVHFFPRGKADETPPPPSRGSAVVAAAPVVIDAAEVSPPVARSSGSAEELEIEPGSDTAAPAPPPAPMTRPPARPTTHALTPPQVKPVTPPVANPPATPEVKPAPPPAEDGCDEVSCVLEKYQRECCARFKPADSGFHPKTEVPESLDKAMVRAGIEKVKPKVIACGEKAAAKGTVKLAMTVSPDGNITEISVAETPDPALGDCVLAAVKRASFGKSTNGASFTFPFAF